MKMTKVLLASVFLIGFGAAFPAMAKDTIDAEDFVEEASAKGLAEVEAANLALKKSNAADIKSFAQTMIADHTAANEKLKSIAQQKNLKVATEAELTKKAKALILKQRDGESFNAAYARSQVADHKDTIELFNKAAVSEDVELAGFATATLPKLEHHLMMAQELEKAHKK
ncbi:MAG: DUF4142 domain-containing protein [Pseudomonadota bacterium]